jgi:glycosyltransferase involved in cell wall biosynthesis
VVAAAAGGPLEIIEHGRNGFLVRPGDYEELARIILLLLGDRGAAARVAEEGYRDARRRFSAPAHAEAMRELYEEVLVGRRKAAAQPTAVGGRC